MKETKLIVMLFVALFGVSCSTSQFCGVDNELISDLNKAGVTESNTKKLVFVGSEANFGSLRVEIDDNQTIKEVWSMLHKSTQGGKHYTCGWVEIEFYESTDNLKSNATLRIYCGGDDAGIYVKEAQRTVYDEKTTRFVGLYWCAGLENYVMKSLEKKSNENRVKR